MQETGCLTIKTLMINWKNKSKLNLY